MTLWDLLSLMVPQHRRPVTIQRELPPRRTVGPVPESPYFREASPSGGYWREKYPTSIRVRANFPETELDRLLNRPALSHVDEIKGLNTGHALWRATQNWPSAKIDLLHRILRASPELLKALGGDALQALGLAPIPHRLLDQLLQYFAGPQA